MSKWGESVQVDRTKFTIRRVKNSWNIRHWRISRQHVYVRNFRHLYSPAGNLIVSRCGVCRSVWRGRSKGARDSPPGNAALFRSSSPIAAEVDFSGRAPFPWPKIYERRSTFQGRRIYARSPASFDGLREASVCASIGPLLVNYSWLHYACPFTVVVLEATWPIIDRSLSNLFPLWEAWNKENWNKFLNKLSRNELLPILLFAHLL